MTTGTLLSTIICRLCGEKCYGQMDTGRWDMGHKRGCRMHPDHALQPKQVTQTREGGDHNFTDPCPVSGRCGMCGERPEHHPIYIRPLSSKRS